MKNAKKIMGMLILCFATSLIFNSARLELLNQDYEKSQWYRPGIIFHEKEEPDISFNENGEMKFKFEYSEWQYWSNNLLIVSLQVMVQIGIYAWLIWLGLLLMNEWK